MSEWKTKSLRELVSYLAKGIPPKYAKGISDNTIYVLNQKCNRDFKINYIYARLNDCSKKKVSNEKYLKIYDVLINSTGVGTAGRVAQVFDLNTKTTVDGHMIIVRPDKSKIDPIYFGYALKRQQRLIESLAEGSTGQTEINRNRLMDEILINYPESRKLQKYIANFFINIDKKIELNNKINHNFLAYTLLLLLVTRCLQKHKS